ATARLLQALAWRGGPKDRRGADTVALTRAQASGTNTTLASPPPPARAPHQRRGGVSSEARNHLAAEQLDRSARILVRQRIEIDLQRGDFEAADAALVVADLLADVGRRANPGGALVDLGVERL